MFTPQEAEGLALLLARAAGTLRGTAHALGSDALMTDAHTLDHASRDVLARALRAAS